MIYVPQLDRVRYVSTAFLLLLILHVINAQSDSAIDHDLSSELETLHPSLMPSLTGEEPSTLFDLLEKQTQGVTTPPSLRSTCVPLPSVGDLSVLSCDLNVLSQFYDQRKNVLNTPGHPAIGPAIEVFEQDLTRIARMWDKCIPLDNSSEGEQSSGHVNSRPCLNGTVMVAAMLNPPDVKTSTQTQWVQEVEEIEGYYMDHLGRIRRGKQRVVVPRPVSRAYDFTVSMNITVNIVWVTKQIPQNIRVLDIDVEASVSCNNSPDVSEILDPNHPHPTPPPPHTIASSSNGHSSSGPESILSQTGTPELTQPVTQETLMPPSDRYTRVQYACSITMLKLPDGVMRPLTKQTHGGTKERKEGHESVTKDEVTIPINSNDNTITKVTPTPHNEDGILKDLTKVRVLSINLWNYNYFGRRLPLIQREIVRANADVITFQEVRAIKGRHDHYFNPHSHKNDFKPGKWRTFDHEKSHRDMTSSHHGQATNGGKGDSTVKTSNSGSHVDSSSGVGDSYPDVGLARYYDKSVFTYQMEGLIDVVSRSWGHQFNWQYVPAMTFDEGNEVHTEGLAIISALPVHSFGHLPLSQDQQDRGDFHRRICLYATVSSTPISPSDKDNDNNNRVIVATTHLSLSQKARNRTLPEIAAHFIPNSPALPSPPVIITGDFNDDLSKLQNHPLSQDGYRDAWVEYYSSMSTNDDNTSTNVTTPTVTSNSTTAQPSKLLSGSFNSWDEPTKRRRIDYIFVRGNLQVQNISLMGTEPIKVHPSLPGRGGVNDLKGLLYPSDHLFLSIEVGVS